MTEPEFILLISSLLLAIPTVRAASRVLSARRKYDVAKRKELLLPRLKMHQHQAETITIERLKNQANDLIEFGSLVPTWAVWSALCGMFLNICARAYPIFVS